MYSKSEPYFKLIFQLVECIINKTTMDINSQNYKRYTTIDILEEAGSEDAKSIGDVKKLLRGLHVVLEASVLSWGRAKKKKKETKHIRKKKLCLLPSTKLWFDIASFNSKINPNSNINQ